MNERSRQMVAIALAGVAVALLAGCGGSDEEPRPGVPKATSDALVRELDLAEERLRVTRDEHKAGACQDIESKSYPSIEVLVSQIPDDTDPQVLEALKASIARLRELTAAECEDLAREIQQEGSGSEPDPVPVPETVPETTEETTPETTPEKAPKEKEPKKDKGNGGGALPPGLDPSQPGQGGGAVSPSGGNG